MESSGILGQQLHHTDSRASLLPALGLSSLLPRAGCPGFLFAGPWMLPSSLDPCHWPQESVNSCGGQFFLQCVRVGGPGGKSPLSFT